MSIIFTLLWQDLCELDADFEDLTDSELISCRSAMHERVKDCVRTVNELLPSDVETIPEET